MASKQPFQLISVIVPVGGRFADLRKLYGEYKTGMQAISTPHEFIFVLDGPRREASRVLDELLREGEEFTVVTLTRAFGGAAALMAGFEHAQGDAIVALPAYHQIEASDIRKLVAGLSECDIAVGRRWPRYGNAFDQLRRNTFHGLVKTVTGSQFRDLGCGARAMRRQVLEEMDLYGDQHRFVPIMAARLGFKACEVDLRQSSQDRFSHIYRPPEYARHVLDLFSVFFLVRFTKRPLRFFGMVGAGTFSLGALVMLWLGVQRLFFDQQLADRPVLLLGALLVVLGMQIFALGLLGELIIFTHARQIKDYRVEAVIHYPDTAATESRVERVDVSRNAEIQPDAPPAIVA